MADDARDDEPPRSPTGLVLLSLLMIAGGLGGGLFYLANMQRERATEARAEALRAEAEQQRQFEHIREERRITDQESEARERKNDDLLREIEAENRKQARMAEELRRIREETAFVVSSSAKIEAALEAATRTAGPELPADRR